MSDKPENERVINPFSLRPVFIEVYGGDACIGTATGFGYSAHHKHSEHAEYLVTNWHVVTGRNPDTGQQQDMPTHLVVYGNGADGTGVFPGCAKIEISLIDSKTGEATWLEHPDRGFVDVVCLPLSVEREWGLYLDGELRGKPQRDRENYRLLPVDQFADFDPTLPVGSQAFVVGFPFGNLAHAHREDDYLPTPIWKAGTIATERRWSLVSDKKRNFYSPRNLPYFYLDTASRPGMSGSPVVTLESSASDNGRPTAKWVGVYSGRTPGNRPPSVDPNEDFRSYASRVYKEVFDAQLGIVWDAEIVREIAENGVPGSTTPPKKR